MEGKTLIIIVEGVMVVDSVNVDYYKLGNTMMNDISEYGDKLNVKIGKKCYSSLKMMCQFY